MNRDWVLFHLREARKQLEQTINEIETDESYSYGDYQVDMSHAYHHLNTAWNSQDATDQEAKESNDGNFERWRQFPIHIDLSA